MDNLAYRGASGNDDAFTTEEVYDSELKKLEEERYSETYDEIADLPSRSSQLQRTNALMPNNIVYRSAVSDISGVISELHTLRSAMFRKEALKNGFIAVPNNGLCKECSNAPRRDISKDTRQYDDICENCSSFTTAAKKADEIAMRDLQKKAEQNGYILLPIQRKGDNSKYYSLCLREALQMIKEEVSNIKEEELRRSSLPPSCQEKKPSEEATTEKKQQPTKSIQSKDEEKKFDLINTLALAGFLFLCALMWLLLFAMFFMGCISLVMCKAWVDTDGHSGFRYDRISVWAIVFSLSMLARCSASCYLYFMYKRCLLKRPSLFIVFEIPFMVYLLITFITGCVLTYGSLGYLFMRGLDGFCGVYYSGVFLVLSLLWLLLLLMSPPAIHYIVKMFR